MSIKRYDFGTEYRGNTGAPAIVGKVNGRYVKHEEYAALATHNELLALQLQKAHATETKVRTTADLGLLQELRHAHQIIHNALNIMTPKQKEKWAQVNQRDLCDGDGTTRANERRALLEQDTGACNE